MIIVSHGLRCMTSFFKYIVGLLLDLDGNCWSECAFKNGRIKILC